MKRWDFWSVFKFILAVFFLAVVFAYILLPPSVIFHRKPRRIVLERVESAGGWEKLRSECNDLLTNPAFAAYRPTGNIRRPFNGSLPNGLAALQPREIQLDLETNHPAIVKIKLFGSGKTDWTPYYGIWVVCGPDAANYTPTVPESRSHPYTIESFTNAVFEVDQK